MISADQRQQFAEQGYVVTQGLLDVGTDVYSFRDAFIGYLDALADICVGKTNSVLRTNYSTLTFPERFATLLGCSGGKVMQHLDPSLSIYIPGYQRDNALPSAQPPALFQLMRNERLLDALETFLGPEISVSSRYHLNLKLSRQHMAIAASIAAAVGQIVPQDSRWNFHIGTTPWHRDSRFGLPDSYCSQIINAWIPITPATVETGCLLVEPGSHRLSPERVTVPNTSVPVPAAPGDVIFLHNNIRHAALPNRSAEEIRWAFNCRYLPTGEPTGQPCLPEFVARSQREPDRELRDPQLWSNMWQAALDFLSINPPPRLDQKLNVAEAQAITMQWRAMTAKYADWLRLTEKKHCVLGRETLSR